MDSLVALEYPNGRTHETSVTTSHELTPGAGFDLHGRHWRVVEFMRTSRSERNVQGRIRCLSVGEIALGIDAYTRDPHVLATSGRQTSRRTERKWLGERSSVLGRTGDFGLQSR